MKRKTAREILADPFHELAENRQIDKITVREIAANCSYSTATFIASSGTNTISSPGTMRSRSKGS